MLVQKRYTNIHRRSNIKSTIRAVREHNDPVKAIIFARTVTLLVDLGGSSPTKIVYKFCTMLSEKDCERRDREKELVVKPAKWFFYSHI